MTEENLLKETIEILNDNRLGEKDVRWVGSKDGTYSESWDEFKKIADIKYNNDYGSNSIVDDLVVVGDNWWLERGEYDGSEWWDFHTAPKKEKKPLKFTKIKKEDFEISIKDLNTSG